VIWVDCGGQTASHGCEVVVESEQGEWAAIVIVGREQIVEVPQDVRPAGRVVRTVASEGSFPSSDPDARASAEELIRRFFPDP
jgi:hypothetical protein